MMDTVLGSQHVTAQRIFKLDREKMLLTSISMMGNQEVWEPGQIKKAHCRHVPSAHREAIKPEEGCSCGIWSCKSRRALERLFLLMLGGRRNLTGNAYRGREIFISAQVQQWGKVIECREGYRSEFARIIPDTIQTFPRHNQLPGSRRMVTFLREKYRRGL